jgi:site-specific DNA recombinase
VSFAPLAIAASRCASTPKADGHSLDAQATHIQNYVAAQGWRLIELYTDAGLSAKKGSPRPAFERMLADAREGRFDVIVVVKMNRRRRRLATWAPCWSRSTSSTRPM